MEDRGRYRSRWWRRAAGCGLLAVAALSVTGCRIKAPKIKIEGVSVDSISLKKIDLLIKFKVTNRSDFQIRVRSLDATIVIADQEFATGSVPGPIPPCDPDQSIELSAKAEVDYKKLMLVIREGQKHHGIPYTVIGKGVTEVLLLPIPVKVSGEGKLQLFKKNKIRNIRLHLIRGNPPSSDVDVEISSVVALHSPEVR